MASASRKIVIEFLGKDSGVGSTAKQIEQQFGTLGAKMHSVGNMAGKLLAGGLLLGGAAAVQAGQAAAEDEAAQAQLAQQLKKAANASDGQISSLESWITAQGKATGITDDELRPALAKLATATGNVDEAQKAAALSMDIAAGAQKDLGSVSQAVAKAYATGNVTALGKYGVATKDAEGKTKSLAAITDELAKKYSGAAAKAADTTAGKQKILTTQFGELQEQIGAKLLPVMVQLAEAGLKVVNWISNNATTTKILVGTFVTLLAVLKAVSVAMAIQTAVMVEGSLAAKAFAAVQWLVNAALSANPIGLVVLAIAALVTGLVIAYKKSETFRDIVNGAFGAIKDTVGAVVGWLVGFIKDHWLLMLTLVAGPMGLIVGLVIKNWDKIKAVISVAMDIVRDVISSVWNAVTGIVRGALNAYFGIVQAGFQAVKTVVGNVMGAIRTTVDNVWDAIRNGFSNVKDRLSDIAGGIKTVVSNAFDAIKAPIQAVIDKIEWLIGKINDLIAKIKSIPHPDLPHIPGLRTSADAGAGTGVKGSITSGPLTVGLGSRMGSSSSTGGGDTYEITVNGALDPNAVADQIETLLRRRQRITGRRILVAQ